MEIVSIVTGCAAALLIVGFGIWFLRRMRANRTGAHPGVAGTNGQRAAGRVSEQELARFQGQLGHDVTVQTTIDAAGTQIGGGF